MPSGEPDDPTTSPPESPAQLRARAARTREYALVLRFDEASARLIALADELDARADALERTATAD